MKKKALARKRTVESSPVAPNEKEVKNGGNADSKSIQKLRKKKAKRDSVDGAKVQAVPDDNFELTSTEIDAGNTVESVTRNLEKSTEMKKERQARKRKNSEPIPVASNTREATDEEGNVQLTVKKKKKKRSSIRGMKETEDSETDLGAAVESNNATVDDSEDVMSNFEESTEMKRAKARKRKNGESATPITPNRREDTDEDNVGPKLKVKKRKEKHGSISGAKDAETGLHTAVDSNKATVDDTKGITSNSEKIGEVRQVAKAKKVKKRGGPNNNVNEVKTPKCTKELCLAYLRSFGTPGWKYCKKQQHWLLTKAFDESILNEEDFKRFLCYIENLKGGKRESLQVQARKYLLECSDEEEADDPKVQYIRARAILQRLA